MCTRCSKREARIGLRSCQICADSATRYRQSGRGRRNDVLWRQRNPDYGKYYNLAKVHQLTPEGFKQLWDSQQGLCALCEESLEGTAIHIDHNHACCSSTRKNCGKCRRGILHRRCNQAIGLLGDSAERCQKAADYLRRF